MIFVGCILLLFFCIDLLELYSVDLVDSMVSCIGAGVIADSVFLCDFFFCFGNRVCVELRAFFFLRQCRISFCMFLRGMDMNRPRTNGRICILYDGLQCDTCFGA